LGRARVPRSLHGAQAEFGAGKGGIADPTAHSGGGTSKEDVAAAPRQLARRASRLKSTGSLGSATAATRSRTSRSTASAR
jgi:hypothetical protein